jgi:hypothetical protein
MISRRSLFVGSAALFCAPAIVRAANIMKVRPVEPFFPSGYLALVRAEMRKVITAQGDLFAAMNGTIIDTKPGDLIGAHFEASPDVRLMMDIQALRDKRTLRLYETPEDAQPTCLFFGLPIVVRA